MKEKILIVDDASFMIMMIAKILEPNGYEIIRALDGFQAVEQFREHKPALIFMDIIMPNCNGIDAIKEIKAIDSGAKIVMLSAMGIASYITDSLLAGAVDFIVKPFKEDRLLATAKRHLSEYVEIDLDEVRLWMDENPDAKVKRGVITPQSEIDALINRVTKPL